MKKSFHNAVVEKMIRDGLQQNLKALSNQVNKYFSNDEIKIVLLGSGGPLPSERAQTSTAVFVNGQFLLFDCGPGSIKTATYKMQIPLNTLTAIFLSHYHFDHIGDLGNFIENSWVSGRQQSLPVYGPNQVAQVVNGVNDMLSQDLLYRHNHHGDMMPLESANAIPCSFPLPSQQSCVEVYEKDGVVVKAFFADHAPVDSAVGYVIEYKNKKIVISGDTNRTQILEDVCENADLLIGDAMNKKLVNIAHDVFKNTRMEKIFHDILSYHMDLSELAKIAQTKNVKKLVLHHITPAVPNEKAYKFLFVKPCKEVYSGELIDSFDGQMISLKY